MPTFMSLPLPPNGKANGKAVVVDSGGVVVAQAFVDDEDHLQAYTALRQTRQRISPVVFMKHLQRRYESVSAGEPTAHEFWAVPKCNSVLY